jgi:L-amino acid N-acyltransferase YncA
LERSIYLDAAERGRGIGRALRPAVGFEFGNWIDIESMQRALGPVATALP